jgi:outer membrane protein
MKRIITMACAAVTVASFTLPAMATTKIGVVNFQKVFQNVPQGQATVEKMRDSLKPKVEQVKKTQQQLEKQIKDFERNAPTMGKSQRAAEQKKLQEKQGAFQKQVTTIHDDQLKKEQAAAVTFQNDLKKAINQVAKDGHYNLIFNSQAAPYSDSDYDVTKQVIADMKK